VGHCKIDYIFSVNCVDRTIFPKIPDHLHFNHSAQNLRINKRVSIYAFSAWFKAINVEDLLEFGGIFYEQ
jgi:hypothetical protein